jgi:hypothetical protein
VIYIKVLAERKISHHLYLYLTEGVGQVDRIVEYHTSWRLILTPIKRLDFDRGKAVDRDFHQIHVEQFTKAGWREIVAAEWPVFELETNQAVAELDRLMCVQVLNQAIQVVQPNVNTKNIVFDSAASNYLPLPPDSPNRADDAD